ncbi:MAG: hypothetical protein WBA07_33680 [Rivularia sp. (in: cyanobacteria)]
MSLTLAIKSFASRSTRKSATGGKIRKFAANAGSKVKKEPSGFTAKLWDGFAKFSVSLLGEVWGLLSGFVSWSATAIWGTIIAAKEFIFNFNWNPSDAQLDADIKNAFNALPGIVGSVLGKATGYIACGAIPTAIIFSFNESLGYHIFKELGEEALDEFAGEIANIVRITFRAVGVSAFAFAHKQIRTLWRETDDNFKKRLESAGLNKKYVEDAISERNKPFIIRQKLDQRVESIKSKPLKDFVENFLDEFDSGCVEAGYVVAGGIDSYVAQQEAGKDILQGKSQNIEVEVDENGKINLKEYKESITK